MALATKGRVGTLELAGKGAAGGGLDEMIISLYAGGMTVRDIQHTSPHDGTDLCTRRSQVRRVAEEVKAWQSRPLEEFYPMLLDAWS